MASRSLLKICTAAFAGSIIGIAYERLSNNDYNQFDKHQSPSTISHILQSVQKDPNYYSNLFASLVGQSVEAKVLTKQHDNYQPYPTKNHNSNLPDVLKELPSVDPAHSVKNFKISSQFGLPSTDNLRIFNDFILSYDRRLRSPVWVLEHLTPEKLKGPAKRDNVNFEQDKALHEYFSAKDSDFHNSGFDRGHMAAAANHKSSQANLEQTFFYSNIIPQDPICNREGWHKLEKYVRWRTNRAKNMFVVSGPLYVPMRASDDKLYVTYQVIGNNHISVPTHLFKILLYEGNDGEFYLEAFLMSNNASMNGKTKLDEYRLSHDMINIIERSAGVIFFDQLTRGRLKEAQLPTEFKS